MADNLKENEMFKMNGNGVSVARNLIWIAVVVIALITSYVTTRAEVETLKETVKEVKAAVEKNKQSNTESSQNRVDIHEMKQDIKDIKKSNIDVLVGIAKLQTILTQNNRNR